MWARLSDPGSYEALQYFISEAPWEAETLWKRLRAIVPERRGGLILDGTSFPKHGTASVGVARQYCGALGKIANCQVAVTVALWTGVRAWCLGARLYLPAGWLTPAQRARAKIPASVHFQRKWCLALTLFRQVRAAGFEITAVVGDAEFGDNATLRRTLHRATAVCLGRLVGPESVSRHAAPAGARPARRQGPAAHPSCPPGRRLDGDRRGPRGGAARPRVAPRVVAPRDEPPLARPVRGGAGHSRARLRHRRLAPEVWLLCERDLGATPRTKYYLVHLPATASLRALARLAHKRWAIEQQYEELKDELGRDHFEGRSLPGWQRHVVLTALTYSFLQDERRQRRNAGLTLPQVRAVVHEILTAHLFITQPHYLDVMLKLREIELRT